MAVTGHNVAVGQPAVCCSRRQCCGVVSALLGPAQQPWPLEGDLMYGAQAQKRRVVGIEDRPCTGGDDAGRSVGADDLVTLVKQRLFGDAVNDGTGHPVSHFNVDAFENILDCYALRTHFG